jgi:hypothetical protein
LPPIPVSTPTVVTRAPTVSRLVWLTGSLAGQEHDVPPQGFWIGREAPAEVLLREAGISRLHLWVGERDGELIALDERSSNGTFVAGERIVRHALRDGDVVYLARDSSFRLETGGRR